MHVMDMKTRLDAQIDVHMHACEHTNKNVALHTHAYKHPLYPSACFTTLLWLAGGLWPSTVLQRQPVMCQDGENEEGGNTGRERKEKEEDVDCQLTMK